MDGPVDVLQRLRQRGAMDDAPDLEAPVRCLADLDARWRWLAGPWGFSVPQLFGLVLEADGRQVPTVINVKDAADQPPIEVDAHLVGALVDQLARVVQHHAPGGSVALMWARPGSGPSRRADREVLRTLHGGLREAPFATWPLWFATDDTVRVVPPDDLVA